MDVGHGLGRLGIDTVNHDTVIHLLGADAHLVDNERGCRNDARIAGAHLVDKAVVSDNGFAVVRHDFEVGVLPYHLGGNFFLEAVDRSEGHHQREHADGYTEHTENADKRNEETLTLSPQVTPGY